MYKTRSKWGFNVDLRDIAKCCNTRVWTWSCHGLWSIWSIQSWLELQHCRYILFFLHIWSHCAGPEHIIYTVWWRLAWHWLKTRGGNLQALHDPIRFWESWSGSKTILYLHPPPPSTINSSAVQTQFFDTFFFYKIYYILKMYILTNPSPFPTPACVSYYYEDC